MKKVLIIDDSALMRRVMSDIIEEDEQLTVADTAQNGLRGLELISRGNHYDIILLDLQMPKMDGVQFVAESKKRGIEIPILIVSSIASQSAKETIQALELGAFDFVRKPANRVGEEFLEYRQDLLMKIYCACGLKRGRLISTAAVRKKRFGEQTGALTSSRTVTSSAAKPETTLNRPSVAPKVRKGDKLVVIASSTGGPKALQSVVPLFPAGFPYPIVVVQHMPAGFTASLAARLNELSPLHVKEAEDGETLKKGYIYIAMGGKQCELVQKEAGRYTFSENDKPPRGGLRPCADIFFESLMNTSLEEVICGVLTGMGADATKGILQVRETKRVKVVAQDEETCVVYGMPRAAKEAGVVDDVVPLESVAPAMMKKIGV